MAKSGRGASTGDDGNEFYPGPSTSTISSESSNFMIWKLYLKQSCRNCSKGGYSMRRKGQNCVRTWRCLEKMHVIVWERGKTKERERGIERARERRGAREGGRDVETFTYSGFFFSFKAHWSRCVTFGDRRRNEHLLLPFSC